MRKTATTCTYKNAQKLLVKLTLEQCYLYRCRVYIDLKHSTLLLRWLVTQCFYLLDVAAQEAFTILIFLQTRTVNFNVKVFVCVFGIKK